MRWLGFDRETAMRALDAARQADREQGGDPRPSAAEARAQAERIARAARDLLDALDAPTAAGFLLAGADALARLPAGGVHLTDPDRPPFLVPRDAGPPRWTHVDAQGTGRASVVALATEAERFARVEVDRLDGLGWWRPAGRPRAAGAAAVALLCEFARANDRRVSRAGGALAVKVARLVLDDLGRRAADAQGLVEAWLLRGARGEKRASG